VGEAHAKGAEPAELDVVQQLLHSLIERPALGPPVELALLAVDVLGVAGRVVALGNDLGKLFGCVGEGEVLVLALAPALAVEREAEDNRLVVGRAARDEQRRQVVRDADRDDAAVGWQCRSRLLLERRRLVPGGDAAPDGLAGRPIDFVVDIVEAGGDGSLLFLAVRKRPREVIKTPWRLVKDRL
jgi:hypothetical protein